MQPSCQVGLAQNHALQEATCRVGETAGTAWHEPPDPTSVLGVTLQLMHPHAVCVALCSLWVLTTGGCSESGSAATDARGGSASGALAIAGSGGHASGGTALGGAAPTVTPTGGSATAGTATGGSATAGAGAGGSATGGSATGGTATNEACDIVASEYAAELELQLGCDPKDASPCTDRVSAAPGCDCRVFIEPADPFAIEHLSNVASAWFDANCENPKCAATCSTAPTGTCQADANSPHGGRCLTP